MVHKYTRPYTHQHSRSSNFRLRAQRAGAGSYVYEPTGLSIMEMKVGTQHNQVILSSLVLLYICMYSKANPKWKVHKRRNRNSTSLHKYLTYFQILSFHKDPTGIYTEMMIRKREYDTLSHVSPCNIDLSYDLRCRFIK